MSLESSQERTEQEQPRSAASAETAHNPTVEENDEGKPLPADVAPAPVLPNPNDLMALLLTWIRTSDWSTSQTYLRTHPELLTEDATKMLTGLTQYQPDQRVHDILTEHQLLLQIARQQGIEAAYQALLHQQEEANDGTATKLEELLDQVIAWLQTSDWEISQTYLQSHPQLLSDAAEQIMDGLRRAQKEQHAQAVINSRQVLLQKVRVEGIESAYEHFLVSKLEMPINEEVATYPALQDPVTLNEAGKAALHQHLVSGQTGDLNRALAYWYKALKLTPFNSPDRPRYVCNLGIGLSACYERTRDLADLEAAISAYQQAVQISSSNSPYRAGYLNTLGNELLSRYDRTEDLADLEAAISAFQQAVEITPSNSSDQPLRLSNLGSGLGNRYQRTGNLADLEAAISAYQQAVETSSSNSPDRPRYLNTLGRSLDICYERTGNLADLEAAISAFRQAVEITPSNSSLWPGYLSNLGFSLRNRYERTGNLADLEAAISACQQAVETSSSNFSLRPGYLSNLSNGLRSRYERTGNLADLEAAISAFQQALEATPSNSPDRPLRLNNLGNVLLIHYWRTEDLTDLEVAISAFQQAVETTSHNSSLRHGYLNNLGNGLLSRYERTSNLADLEAAISAYQQAVDTIPSNSPDRPLRLNNLGRSLHSRFERTGDLADLEAAISAWERSWSVPYPSFAVLPVTYQLGQQRKRTEVAAHLVTAYLEQARQHHSRSHSVPYRALEIAEGSKSHLLTQLVGRGPLPLPSELSQEIATREQQLLAELTIMDTQELASSDHLASTQEGNSHLQRLQQRQVTLRELEDLWIRIARVGPEGTAYVALRRSAAPTWQELARLAKELGSATALLSFFTTADRALLFLLRAGWRAPRVVEVPLNKTGWTDLLWRFFREVLCYGPGLRRSTTWDLLLHPLFNKAQHHLEGVERLILSTEGPGHLLPWGVLVERAGWHTSTGQPLPLVTLPALGILPRLRQRPHVPPGPVLVIGNPRGDLPAAEVEANVVAERFGTKPLLGGAATKSAVLTRFPDARLIHLATHAFFDAHNPLESGIVLTDGVLTAREVLQHRLQADLLVLSACESGQVSSLGGEELAGLSQAFLQTGVRSLLVSLWRINDLAAAALMQTFYSARQAGADKALALRQAMTQIQQDPHWPHPYYWGAFVLVGDWD